MTLKKFANLIFFKNTINISIFQKKSDFSLNNKELKKI